MRQPTFSLILPFLFFLLFSLYWAASNDHTEKFVECLLNNSNNSTAISQIIYTTHNPLYTKVLNKFAPNLRFDTPETPKPLAVVTPSEESQIQTAIYCSKEVGLQMRIRSRGNDMEGSSYVSYVPFFILDMYGFRSISIDATTETAWVGPGASLGEIYYATNQTDRSLAFPGSYWPSVGAGGHICSGGFGGLLRKYGVSADNVVDARIINVKGEILDRKSMGEDLFWAIRGGSCASFGVVTAFKLKLARIPKDFAVFTVKLMLEQDAISAVYKWQHVAPKMPRDLLISLHLQTILETNSTKPTFYASFIGLFLGDIDGLISLMDQHFPELGVTPSDCAMVGWPESTVYHVGYPVEISTQILLSINPAPLQYLNMKPDFVQHPIPKKGLTKLVDLMLEVEAFLELTPLGEKMDEIPESSIPFPHRKGNIFLVGARIAWVETDPLISKERSAWATKFHKQMGNYVAHNPRRAFVNYRDYDLGTNNINGPTSVEQARSWGLPYYKGNFDRLVRIKTKVDPENYFNYEQSIPVSPSHLRHSDE